MSDYPKSPLKGVKARVRRYKRTGILGAYFCLVLLSGCAKFALDHSTTITAGTATTPSAALSLGTGVLSFGAMVLIASNSDQTMTLTNSGNLGASGISVKSAPTAPFSFIGGTYPGTGGTCGSTLASNASCTIAVRFRPTSVAAFTSLLTLSYSDGSKNQTVSRNFSGTGTDVSLAWGPLTYNFGSFNLSSTSSAQSFTLTNSGTGAATGCSAPVLTGANAAEFSISSDACGTADLAGSGGSCTVQLSATPSASGSRTATLSRTCTKGGTVTTTDNQLIVIGGGGPLAPTAFSISASTPLVVSKSYASLGLTTGAATYNPGLTGSLSASGQTGGAALHLGTVNVIAATLGGTYASGGLSASLATSAFSSTLTVASSWPGPAIQACSVGAPFAAISCAMPTFTVADTDITTSGSFTAKGYASNGGASDFKMSNTLQASYFGTRQISNVSGAGADDAYYAIFAFNNKILSYGSNYMDEYDPVGGTLNRLLGTGVVTWLTVANGGKLYFSAVNSSSVGKLFEYTGSALSQISNVVNNQTQADSIEQTFAYNGDLYFWGNPVNGGTVKKLYRYSGTTLSQISNTRNNQNLDDRGDDLRPATLNSHLYITATGPVRQGLFSFDGTTLQLAGDSQGSNVGNPVAYNGKLYMIARESTCNAYKLHQYDETGGTFKQISNSMNNACADDWIGAPNNYVVAGGKLYFPLYNLSGKSKLFEFSSTGNTLTQVSNTANNNGLDDAPTSLFAYNNKVFFVALNSNAKQKIYSYDPIGSTLTQITNFGGATTDDIPTNATCSGSNCDLGFTIYNGNLIFRASNASGFGKWFSYNDTAGVVSQITNFRGAASDVDWTLVNIRNTPLTAITANTLFLHAYNFAGKWKLFSICDPGAGCTP